MQKIGIHIDTPALGDTIASIPTIRKISEAYNSPITVFSTKPFLFKNHPVIEESLGVDKINHNKYKIYKTFNQLAGKSYSLDGQTTEFRYSNCDIRQYHALSLGFTLTVDEMEMDLYVEKPRPLHCKNYVMIHPTHTWATRTWAQDKWQLLIDKLYESGIPVVAVGRDSKELGFFNTNKPVMDVTIKNGINLLNDPTNDPAELRWMMKNEAKVLVTMDSGLLHLAGTTDINIIQLGSSIHPKLRAPYRKGSQNYKYSYIKGPCNEFCSSNMKYNIKEHNSIMGIPPQVNCLEGKAKFECHPEVDIVYYQILKLFKNEQV